jgi:hypothetical protein
MDYEWIGLADAIGAVRREINSAQASHRLAIKTAQANGEEEGIRFELGPIELEFALDVRTEKAGGAAFGIWAANVGGKLARSSDSVLRVKLTMTPQQGDGGPAYANDSLEANTVDGPDWKDFQRQERASSSEIGSEEMQTCQES